MYVGVYSAVYVAFHVTVSSVGVHPLNAYVYVPSDGLVNHVGVVVTLSHE